MLEVRVWAGLVMLDCFGPDLEQTRRALTKRITRADGLDYANGLDQLRGWIGLITRTDWTDQAGFDECFGYGVNLRPKISSSGATRQKRDSDEPDQSRQTNIVGMFEAEKSAT